MPIDRLLPRFAALAPLAALVTLLACGNSDEQRAEEALLTADSSGAQGLASLNYEITSDVFKKWKAAQLGLDRALGKAQSKSLKTFILGDRPTREAIERSVARIEGDARAKRAIEDAGMSPRHYVVATVALFQATRGTDPLTGEAFRGVPARNVEFAARNREEIEAGDDAGEFQQIADSIAAVRAASEDIQEDTMSVQVDTVQRPVPLPAPVPVPAPMPIPTPVPEPPPTPPTTPGIPGL